MKPFPGRVAAARDERYLRVRLFLPSPSPPLQLTPQQILEQKFEAAKTRREAEESSNSQDYAAWRSKAKKAEKEAEQFAFGTFLPSPFSLSLPANELNKDDENALFWDTALSDTQKALLKTFNVKTCTLSPFDSPVVHSPQTQSKSSYQQVTKPKQSCPSLPTPHFNNSNPVYAMHTISTNPSCSLLLKKHLFPAIDDD